MTEEEGEQQQANMAAVHVRIGHADNLMVAELALVKVRIHAGAEGGDHGPNLVVGEHSVHAGLLHIENLAS